MSAGEAKDTYFFGLKPEEATMKGHATRRANEQCQYMLPALHQMLADDPRRKLLDVGCGQYDRDMPFLLLKISG